MPNLKNVIIGKGKNALDSQSYAALWGSGTSDGALFYNVSSAPLNELGWSFTEWFDFAKAIHNQLEAFNRKPSDYDANDKEDLLKLYRWATRCARRVRNNAAEKTLH